ncbi:enoyl-CoA hydratase/isomerase family protein [Hyalangium rubrum]|uniref:Enoyl-CoA hydratase-related protein n=1 Tax=Hyalangium rubrum TaxID=3103134 RepID=A0ABU5H6C4_9BACT|nr:enoyl-CoA hydratase-related protein [Hyalangium sp. s54d21]MDY7228682.1 enoyl-CoA hydratase-related protein [Hyalangium sp. s54d21]
MESTVEVEDREDGIRVLTLVNPTRRNALDDEMLDQLDAALSVPSHVRAFLVRGAGGTFCSGYDLTVLGPPTGDGRLPDDTLMGFLSRLERHPLPSVAQVQGAAFGAGFDLASACDFRVGTPQTVFCMPPARLGVVYSVEGMSRVARLVGVARAKAIFLTAQKVDGETALAWGLLDECYAADRVEDGALELCRTLAANAPLAVSGMKEVLGLMSQHTLSQEQLSRARALRTAAFQSEDLKEGKAAFLEKRSPRFQGR